MSPTRIPGKILYAGYDWTARITFATSAVSFPEGSTFIAHVRSDPKSNTIEATLSAANGCLTRADDNAIDIVIPGTATAGWSDDRMAYVDIVRNDITPPEHLGFRLVIPVQLPITRL